MRRQFALRVQMVNPQPQVTFITDQPAQIAQPAQPTQMMQQSYNQKQTPCYKKPVSSGISNLDMVTLEMS